MANAKGAEITRLKTVRTPKGIAAFAYLTKPDTSFNKTRYRISVFFDKEDPEFVAFVKLLREEAKKAGLNPKKALPFKLANQKVAEAVKDEAVVVGTPYLELASNGEDKPPIPVYNAAAQQEDGIFVYGGDIVRAEGTLCKWSMTAGEGLKVYLRAVQLLKSNWNGGAGSSFETEDDYLSDDEAPEAEDDPSLEDEGDGVSFDSEGEENEGEDNEEEDPLDGLV